MRFALTALGALSLGLAGCEANAQPTLRPSICSALEPRASDMNELYYRTRDGRIASFEAATFEDLQGRIVDFCYVVSRTEGDLPEGIPQRGAFNLKIEMETDTTTRDLVALYNNRIKTDQCTVVTFESYQAFHEDGNRSNTCLRYGFHNPPPTDFETFEPINRRRTFLFRDGRNSSFHLFGSDKPRPAIKRTSAVYNYVVPHDFSTVRVPFYFTTPRDTSRITVHLDDLLETTNNFPPSSFRRTLTRQ